tara:strand:- start:173 stop:430 length:258 start_codon:yes stop_codon:yes gene_type:complete
MSAAGMNELDELLGPGSFIELTLACPRWANVEGNDHSVIYGKVRDTPDGRRDFGRIERAVLGHVCGLCEAPMKLREPSEGRPLEH